MGHSTKVVALDIHRDSITVAVADPDRQEPRLYGTIASTDEAHDLDKSLRQTLRQSPV